MALWLLLLIPQLFAGTLKEIANTPAQTHQEMAQRAVAEYNEISGDPYKWDLSSIDDVRQQQPIGIPFHMKLTLVQTECRKSENHLSLNDCKHTDLLKECIAESQNHASKDYVSIKIHQCADPYQRTNEKTMHSSFQLEEVLQHIKPEDYDAWKQFVDFMLKHEKMYNGKHDVLKRFQIFKQNLKLIPAMQKRDQGTAVFGITKFADLTPEEFKKTYLPYIWDQAMVPNTMVDLTAQGIDEDDTLPESFDWRDHGAVTEVKDQGDCGSCWAFSTTGNIEGQWFLAKKQLVSLSEQELLDCDKIDEGCSGGLPSHAYNEIMRMGGLETEKAYPYHKKNEKCHMDRSKTAVYINGSVELPHDEEIMKKWLVKKGPISIGMNADPLVFYDSGILHPDENLCPPDLLDHGVLLVGYGIERNISYWIIKNSWGPNWGENGYFRLYRGENACGIHKKPTSAIVN